MILLNWVIDITIHQNSNTQENILVQIVVLEKCIQTEIKLLQKSI